MGGNYAQTRGQPDRGRHPGRAGRHRPAHRGGGVAIPHRVARRRHDLGWTTQPDGTAPTAHPRRRRPVDLGHRARSTGACSCRSTPTPCSRSPSGPRRAAAPRSTVRHAGVAVVALQRGGGHQPQRLDPPGRSPPRRSPPPTPDNRMIGYPYTKRMNSNNMVEQGAGPHPVLGRGRRVARCRPRPLGLPAGGDRRPRPLVHVQPCRPVLVPGHPPGRRASPRTGRGGRGRPGPCRPLLVLPVRRADRRRRARPRPASASSRSPAA